MCFFPQFMPCSCNIYVDHAVELGSPWKASVGRSIVTLFYLLISDETPNQSKGKACYASIQVGVRRTTILHYYTSHEFRWSIIPTERRSFVRPAF